MSAAAASAERSRRHRRQKDIVGKRGITGIMEVCAGGIEGMAYIGYAKMLASLSYLDKYEQ